MSAPRRSSGTGSGSARVARVPSVLRLLDEEKNPIGDAREGWVAAEEAAEFKESPRSTTHQSSGRDDGSPGLLARSPVTLGAASPPLRPGSRRTLRASISMTDISHAEGRGSGVGDGGSGQRRSSVARRRLLDAKRVDRQLAPMQGSAGEGASKLPSPTPAATSRASPLEPLSSPGASLRSHTSQSASLSSSPMSPYARGEGAEPCSPRLGPFPPARPSSRGSGQSPRKSPTLRSRRMVATTARLEPLSPSSPQPAAGRISTPTQRRRPAGGQGFELLGGLPTHGTRTSPRRRTAAQH